MIFRLCLSIWVANRKMFHVKHHRLSTEEYTAPYLSTMDFLVTGEPFDLVWDQQRDMLVTRPQPSETEIGRYYQSDAYVSHNDSKKGLINFLYQTVKSYSLFKKEKLIVSLNEGRGRLLDVGAGTGDFLAKAKNKGWEVHGVEVNEIAREKAKEKGLMLKTDLEAFSGQHFDVITLWHVLEHLHGLEAQIKKLNMLLSKNGTLVVAVPNFRSYDAKHYGKFWAAYDTPRHLWHFSRSSMHKLFTPQFTLERIKPMLFDAFYVSLLSEKYQTGKNFSLKALWVGGRSNLCALRSKEYSSLIYCFKNRR